ncbi:MAG: transposase [Roseofilum sp. Guam]|nr:transposase [Roseofilum sp. Guam]
MSSINFFDTGFHLTPGQVHDLQGADVLLECIDQMGALLADKTYDAAQRVLDRLKGADCLAVISPKSNRTEQRQYDQEMYKWRHLIENLFQKFKQYREIATRYDKMARNFCGDTPPIFRCPDCGFTGSGGDDNAGGFSGECPVLSTVCRCVEPQGLQVGTDESGGVDGCDCEACGGLGGGV